MLTDALLDDARGIAERIIALRRAPRSAFT